MNQIAWYVDYNINCNPESKISGTPPFGISALASVKHMYGLPDTKALPAKSQFRSTKIATRFIHPCLPFEFPSLKGYKGSDSLIHGLISRMQHDLGMSFSSLIALRMDPELRNTASEAFVPTSKVKVTNHPCF